MDVRDARIGFFAGCRKNRRAGAGHRPLRGRGALAAVFERLAKLAFRRAKMRSRGRGSGAACAAVEQQRRDGQRKRHRRARAVQPAKRHAAAGKRKRRRGALVLQIACQNQIELRQRQIRFFRRQLHRRAQQRLFRFLPGGHAEGHVVKRFVKRSAQRTVLFFFAGESRVRNHARRVCQAYRVLSDPCGQIKHLLSL